MQFFCGPDGQLVLKDGFIYDPKGNVVGSYSELRTF